MLLLKTILFFLIIFFARKFLSELGKIISYVIEKINLQQNRCRYCKRKLIPSGWYDQLRCPNNCEWKKFLKKNPRLFK